MEALYRSLVNNVKVNMSRRGRCTLLSHTGKSENVLCDVSLLLFSRSSRLFIKRQWHEHSSYTRFAQSNVIKARHVLLPNSFRRNRILICDRGVWKRAKYCEQYRVSDAGRTNISLMSEISSHTGLHFRCSDRRSLLRDPNSPSLNINLRISSGKRHKRRCFKVGTS